MPRELKARVAELALMEVLARMAMLDLEVPRAELGVTVTTTPREPTAELAAMARLDCLAMLARLVSMAPTATLVIADLMGLTALLVATAWTVVKA